MYTTIRYEPQYQRGNYVVYACDYHIIWCTKYRKALLTSAVQQRFKQLIFDKQEAYNYTVRAIEVMPDHIHLLAAIPPHIAVTEVVRKIKGFTAFKLRQEFFGLKRIRSLWTRSKFVASTGGVTLEVLKQYVEHQKENQYD